MMKQSTLSLLCVGFICNTLGAADLCIDTLRAKKYQQAAECYVQQSKKETSFDNLFFTGISYSSYGAYNQAEKYLIEAEKKARSALEYKATYNNLGLVYQSLGNRQQELYYKMKDLDLSLQDGKKSALVSAYTNLGLYFAKENDAQALTYYEKALENIENGNPANIYSNMATFYSGSGNYLKAEEMYLKSIKASQIAGNYMQLAITKANLGAFYFKNDRFSESRMTLEEALVMTHNAGLINWEAGSMAQLALIDKRDGKIQDAQKKISDALRLAKQSGDVNMLSFVQTTATQISATK